MRTSCLISLVLIPCLLFCALAAADNNESRLNAGIAVLLGSDLSRKSGADLLAMLHDEQPLNRWAAVKELAKRKEPGIAPRLRELLKDQSGWVRFGAATALLDMGHQGMLPVLRGLLVSQPEQAKVIIATVLARHGDDSGLDFARAELTSWSFTRRMRAISALAASRNDDVAYPALEAGLEDSNEYVRDMAINHLSSRPGKRSVELLEPLLSDPDHSIRWLTVAALTRNGSRDAIPLLLDMLTDINSSVRGMAAFSLNHLTGQNKPTLLIKPERAKQLEKEWREWWEANKDKPLPSEEKK